MINGTRYRLQSEINRQQALGREIATLQTQLSSQKRLTAPSDDPLAAAAIAGIGRSQATDAAYAVNVRTAAAQAARGDTALETLSTAVTRARELLLSAANATLSADNRAVIAIELRSIAAQVVALADTRDAQGDPVFQDGTPLAVPVAEGLEIAPVESRQAVFDQVAMPGGGTQSLEAIISAAAAAIGQSDPAVRAAAVNTALGTVAAAGDHVATARGRQGVSAARLDTLDETLATTKLEIAEERLALEGTDIAEAVAKLEARRLSLEAAQAVFARLNQNSLFDMLR